MGGCRCTFRACTVNTKKYPKMHFFHFPIKNKERLEQWIKYADYSQFRELSTPQARNKVVCALHFRDEYFMNYKKDRLVPIAIPTLDRLRNGLVIDYAADSFKPIALEPTTEKHLIPPKGFVAFGLPEDYFSDHISKADVLDQEEEEEEDMAPLMKRPKILQNERAPKILNTGVRGVSISVISEEDLESDEVTLSLSEETYEEDFEPVLIDNSKCDLSPLPSSVVHDNQLIDLDDVEFLSSDKVECVEVGASISKALYDQTMEAFESGVLELKQQWGEKEREANAKIARLEAELEATKEKVELELSRAEAAESSAKNWQKQLQAAKEEMAKTVVPCKSKPVVSQFGQLSKPQLFNGIKKYLSASMTALVRMEMFSTAERQWKPDEKQVSVELLRFGENVYKYFSDEWRLRLPPKNLVAEWMNEEVDENEDDL